MILPPNQLILPVITIYFSFSERIQPTKTTKEFLQSQDTNSILLNAIKAMETSVHLLEKEVQSSTNSMKTYIESSFKKIDRLIKNPQLSDWWKACTLVIC